MSGIITVLILIICILLILVVLVQNSKGGGLASGFQASGQVFGVRRTTDFLEKATWGLASGLIILSVLSAVMGTGPTSDKKESVAKESAAAAGDAGDEDAAAAPAQKPAAAPAK